MTIALAICLLVFIGATVKTSFQDKDKKEVCSCRPNEWQQVIPCYRARRWRLVVGIVLFVLAVIASFYSLLLTLLFLYFSIPHLLAYRYSYPGCPELGIWQTLIRRRTCFSGCGPWCWVDKKFYY